MIDIRRWLFISSFLLMLASAFVDNLRGSLIPILYDELHIGFATIGAMILTIAGLAGAVFNSQLLKIEGKYGPSGLIFYSVGLLGLSSVGFLHVTNTLTLATAAIPLGGAITSMGTSANLLLVLSSSHKIKRDESRSRDSQTASRARMMAGLHLMYGVGSLAAPAAAGFFASRAIPWQWLFMIPICLTLIPVGTGVAARSQVANHETSNMNTAGATKQELSRREKIAQWVVVGIFLTYVTGEVLTSMWMPSFLIHHLKLDYQSASQMAASFFIVFSVARLGVILTMKNKFYQWLVYAPLLIAGLLMVFANVTTIPITNSATSMWLLWIFPAAGIIGPFFPMMLAYVSSVFEENWQNLTVIILTSMQVALALSHIVVGNLFDTLGPQLAYLIPPVLLITAGIGTFAFMSIQEKSRFFRATP